MERFRVVTLEELKQQMRVDFEDENDIISLYGVAAEDRVISGTRRSVEELNLMGYIEQNGEPEDTETAEAVYEAFAKDMPAKADIFDKISYTTGHYKRGVE